MPMTEIEQHRLEMLQNRFVDAEYIDDYYGLADFGSREELLADIERYRVTMPEKEDVPADRYDRYALEGFLQARSLSSSKWAAAAFGFKEGFLAQLINRREELPTPLREHYIWYGDLVKTRFAEDVTRVLPALRFRSFSDHENFCESLHYALRQALGFTEQEIADGRLWCATDQALSAAGLGDYPRRFAQYFDCITCEPLSAAHCTWLKFDKPLSLPPDRCSKVVFVRYREELGDLFVGTRPPEDLEQYEEYLAVAQ